MNDDQPVTESPKPADTPDPAAAPPETAHPELAAVQDRHLRLAADFENYKRRTQDEAARRAAMAKDAVLRDLLPVLDNLKRALTSAGHEASSLRTGVEMTLQQFRQVLQQHGCEPDHCVGQVFDPHRQEAVGSRHDPSRPDHVVLEIVQEGWLRGDALLRPAKVIINDLTATVDGRPSGTDRDNPEQAPDPEGSDPEEPLSGSQP